jgi:crotonobetainyl-CoA:carnitine CoA-transferase CaiB-like acyl-CoA transferase
MGCPLENLKVLDLADEKASFCSKLLADLGASVIKVEKPGGDASRNIGPFLGNESHPNRSLSFNHNNMNKLGITLNVEHVEGRKLFLRLLGKHDVVVETFLPGYLEKLGLGFGALSKINEKLIWVSVTGFGQTGPRSRDPCYDIVASAFGGQMSVSGALSTSPLKPFGEQSYTIASLYAAMGILLALKRRCQTGKGEHIDISLQEAVVSALDHVMVRYFYEKVVPRRQGERSWNNTSCLLPCKNGQLFITLFPQWETLVEWMASEGMADDLTDDQWSDEAYRLSHFDHILQVVKRWTLTHTSDELFELGQLMHFPWAPVQSPQEVLDNPQLKARHFFIDVSHPEMDTPLTYPRAPYQWGCSLERRKRAPRIGEDNIEVYQEELGLSEQEMERLHSLHAI